MENVLIVLGIGVVLFFVLNKKQQNNTSIPAEEPLPAEEPPVFGIPINENPRFDNGETTDTIQEPIGLTENEI